MRRPIACLSFVAQAVAAGSANAGTPAVKLVAQTFVERVSTDVNGRQRRILVQPQELGRGDRLVFLVRYRNEGSAPVRGFAVTNPVPTALQIDTTQPQMQVSVDHGRSWGRIEALSVATPLGGTRRATPADVTHVRWNVPRPVRPGQEGRISYRATVR
ncbi:MAG: hypothetical protein QHC67_04320 [Sphingobium sp.]|uniref:hypothetical protein n=1 Tax=Sphingobium sp. TaxID=1912891 RepID=UPI0029BCBC10|nr:hypothetical protein [Sphingobium sp.]MDX3909025.1 hypothetical protein [Sphingobium sp.]